MCNDYDYSDHGFINYNNYVYRLYRNRSMPIAITLIMEERIIEKLGVITITITGYNRNLADL